MNVAQEFEQSTIRLPVSANSCFSLYWKKWLGLSTSWPPLWQMPSVQRLAIGFVGPFVAIGALGIIEKYGASSAGFVGIMYSMGATAVLIYAAPEAPFSQPRNVVFGHFFAALIAIGWRAAWPPTSSLNWLSGAFAVSTAIVVMQITNTLHPPAGATALFVATARDATVDATARSFFVLVFPVLAGIAFMLLVALIVDNLFLQYPVTWT